MNKKEREDLRIFVDAWLATGRFKKDDHQKFISLLDSHERLEQTLKEVRTYTSLAFRQDKCATCGPDYLCLLHKLLNKVNDVLEAEK